MNYSFLDFLSLIGAVGLFLYGMKIMSEGLQKTAGDRMRNILSAMTKNRFAGLITGIFITALIQSSSASTVMVVSFVNAGLMSLADSMAVIMGANVGTTFTAWIISIFGGQVNVNAFILMTDDKDAIVRKCKRAVTDSDGCVRFDRENKPGVSNLMTIYGTFTGKSMDEITAEFEGKGYGDFKMAVAEVTADALAPVQAEYGKILADKAYVDEVLKSGAERASRLANRTVNKVYRKVGLLQLDK